MLSEYQDLVNAGYSNSRPPDKELGSVTKWLASQLQVYFSAGFSTGERKKRRRKKDGEKKNESKKKSEQRKIERKYRVREKEG
jgi:hypothetical protein